MAGKVRSLYVPPPRTGERLRLHPVSERAHRLENAWAYAADRWIWNGLRVNAFRHRRTRT
jgi:hypothetical protein